MTRADQLRADLRVAELTGVPRQLAEEMCLTLERLERLDAVLQGDVDAWLGVLDRMPEGYAEVVINAPLAEVRQQGAAFRGLAAEFAKQTGAEQGSAPASTSDELSKKREDRRSQALGTSAIVEA